MTASLRGKVVLITGAARPTGQDLAVRLAAAGADIVAVDLNPIGLDQTLRRVVEAGGRGRAYPHDPTKRLPAVTLVQQVLNDWGRIDVLIYAAEVAPETALLALDEWDFHRVMDVNLAGPLLLLQLAIPIMRDQGRGWIIALGADPSLASAAYQASKAALASLMSSAARQSADSSIEIIHIPPGPDLADEILRLLNA